MGRNVPMFALLAGITLSTFSATAQNGFSLTSVNVDLPTSDRVLPDGPGADVANICMPLGRHGAEPTGVVEGAVASRGRKDATGLQGAGRP
jgi:hypothetical protein